MNVHDCLSIFLCWSQRNCSMRATLELCGEIFTAVVYFFIATLSEKNC